LDKLFGGSESSSTNNSGGQNFGQNQNYANGIDLNYGTNNSGNYSQNNGGSYGQNTSNNFGFNQGNSWNTGGGSSQGTSQSSSSSNQNVWDQQSPYLQDVYGQAQNAFNQGMDSVNGLSPEVQQQMQQSFQQAQGGYGNQMGGGFAGGLQGQVGPNSYTDAMKGQIADDANTLKQQNLGNLDARAAAAGMSGSSGYRDQVARMQDSVDENAMNQMSNVGYQAHNQGIQNQMNLANMMDRNQQFGTQNLQNIQQGSMNQFNPAMVGMNMAGQYAQTIGGPTTLTDSSSQSSSQNTSNSFNNGGSNNFGMNTGNSQGTNGSFNNGTSMGFSNGMNVGLGMNQGVGFGNNYGSNFGSGASNSNSSNGIIPAIAAGVSAFK
jgi:hypothetical protein